VKGGKAGISFYPEHLHIGLQTLPPNSKLETSLGRLEAWKLECRSFRVDLNPSPTMFWIYSPMFFTILRILRNELMFIVFA